MVGLFDKLTKNEEKKQLILKKKELKKLVKKKNYNKVDKVAREILENNPKDLDVLFILGAVYYMCESYSKAISYFDRVLDVSSYDPEALLLKANCHFKLKEFDTSEYCCNKIKEIDPKNKDVIDLLQNISEMKQRQDKN